MKCFRGVIRSHISAESHQNYDLEKPVASGLEGGFVDFPLSKCHLHANYYYCWIVHIFFLCSLIDCTFMANLSLLLCIAYCRSCKPTSKVQCVIDVCRLPLYGALIELNSGEIAFELYIYCESFCLNFNKIANEKQNKKFLYYSSYCIRPQVIGGTVTQTVIVYETCNMFHIFAFFVWFWVSHHFKRVSAWTRFTDVHNKCYNKYKTTKTTTKAH